MPIRNIAVGKGTAPAGTTHLVYTVPASNAFILKSILIGGLATAETVRVYLQDGEGSGSNFYFNIDVPSGNEVQLATWFVLNAGDSIYLYTDGTEDYTYWVSGAVLPYASV